MPTTGVIHEMSAGTIPLQLSQLHDLEFLDLSAKYLSGELRYLLWWHDETTRIAARLNCESCKCFGKHLMLPVWYSTTKMASFGKQLYQYCFGS